jgi:hypothetical protein
MAIVTEEDLQLDLVVEEAEWLGLFDSLEVWRSRVGISGPYDNLTADAATEATLPDGAAAAPIVPEDGPSVTLDGKTLSLRLDEDTDVDIVFSGTDPMTFAEAAAQISSEVLAAYVVGGILVIKSATTGGNAVIRVVGGDAAAILGLSTTEPDCLAFGRESRVALVSGTTAYAFTDHNGDPSYYYRMRYYNSETSSTGAFGTPFIGTSLSGLDAADTVLATVDLVDGRGVVQANMPVLLHLKNKGTRVNGKTVLGGDLQVLTDENGHAEFSVVRGQQFTVAIAGTEIVRDFTAPTDTAIVTFDMLDPDYSSDDAFTVQKPDLRYAVRRS